MGLSEWGICIESNDDIKRVLKCIKDHNSSEAGEDLSLDCLLRFNGKIWACISNSGGRDATTNFLENWYRDGTEIYYPFQKPLGWNDCQHYVWRVSDGIPPSI